MKLSDYHSKILTKSEQYRELIAFQPLLQQYPIEKIEFRYGTKTPHATVMAIRFYGVFEDFFYPFEVELIPHLSHPRVEPIAVLIEPKDFYEYSMQLCGGKPPHMYSDLDRTMICVHQRDWTERSTLGTFFMNGCIAWANNATALVATEGLWDPDKWFTGTGGKS